MGIILSIDGGSSSTKAGILDSKTKKIIKSCKINKPLNYFSFLNNEFSEILNVVLKKFTENFDLAILGISGADTPTEIELIREKTYNYKHIDKVIIVNDTELVLNNYFGLKKDKVAIVAGTGSNCIGINKVGKYAKSGGLDYLLSDEGSGYWIGKKVLEMAVKSYDNRGDKTQLENMLFESFDVSTPYPLKSFIYSKNFTKKDIAKIMLLAIKGFYQKDKASIEIIQSASFELYLHVKAVVKQLNIDDFVLIKSGSLFQVDPITNFFDKLVKEKFKNIEIYTPEKPSFYGALSIFEQEYK